MDDTYLSAGNTPERALCKRLCRHCSCDTLHILSVLISCNCWCRITSYYFVFGQKGKQKKEKQSSNFAGLSLNDQNEIRVTFPGLDHPHNNTWIQKIKYNEKKRRNIIHLYLLSVVQVCRHKNCNSAQILCNKICISVHSLEENNINYVKFLCIVALNSKAPLQMANVCFASNSK